MAAISSGRATALLAGLLAIVAGILGMHILTGTHAMPASDHPDHVADITALPGASAAQSLTHAPGPACADTARGTMTSTMGGNCIPSPGNTTLAAPPPGTMPLPSSGGTITGIPTIGYAYLPRSPSPGQLSISRT